METLAGNLNGKVHGFVGTMVKRETTSKKTRDSLSRVCAAMNLAKSAELQMLYIQKMRSLCNNHHRPSVCHTDEPQSGRNSCLWLFHLLLDDWGGDPWLPQIGPRVPLAMVSVSTDLVRLA